MNKAIKKISVFSFLCFFLVGGLALQAQATSFTLQDGNSSAIFDTALQSGMSTWDVDGTDQMFQQSFWYRTGSMTAEQNISALQILTEGVTDTDFDGFSDTLFVRYTLAGQFTAEVGYRLAGGTVGSNRSDITEQITISNLSGSALNFSFFQYSDFDLNGTISDDTAMRMNANTIRQWDPITVFGETVVTPAPSAWEIAGYPSILNSLNDNLVTNLANATSPYSGDATWAFQWDTIIGAGDSFQISKDKNIAPIPEPATMLLFGTGLIGLAGLVRKKFSK